MEHGLGGCGRQKDHRSCFRNASFAIGVGMAVVKVGRVSLGQVEKLAIRGLGIIDGQKALVSRILFLIPVTHALNLKNRQDALSSSKEGREM